MFTKLIFLVVYILGEIGYNVYKLSKKLNKDKIHTGTVFDLGDGEKISLEKVACNIFVSSPV